MPGPPRVVPRGLHRPAGKVTEGLLNCLGLCGLPGDLDDPTQPALLPSVHFSIMVQAAWETLADPSASLMIAPTLGPWARAEAWESPQIPGLSRI